MTRRWNSTVLRAEIESGSDLFAGQSIGYQGARFEVAGCEFPVGTRIFRGWISTHDWRCVLRKRPVPAVLLVELHTIQQAKVFAVPRPSLVAEVLHARDHSCAPRLYSVSNRSLSVQSKPHHIAPYLVFGDARVRAIIANENRCYVQSARGYHRRARAGTPLLRKVFRQMVRSSAVLPSLGE